MRSIAIAVILVSISVAQTNAQQVTSGGIGASNVTPPPEFSERRSTRSLVNDGEFRQLPTMPAQPVLPEEPALPESPAR